MVTIADVAQRAGVSITTVSRVLSPGERPHPVSAATAERVRAAAAELHFLPSPLARGLATSRSGLIGLVVPDLTDPHYPQIASGVEEAAREAELAVLISNTLGDADRLTDYLRVLQARRVDAIVLSGGTSLSRAELRTLESSAVPVVLIGRPALRGTLAYVSIDNRQAASVATRHLIAVGRRRIAHLAGPRTQTTMADRAAGYRDAMRAAELPSVLVETSGTPEHGYAQLGAYLERHQADGVFAATDRLAIAALALAADRGIAVPAELAVAGFDDVALAAYLRPSLTTVAQPAHALGRVAIELALRLAAGESVRPVLLEAGLVVRGSTVANA